MVSEHGLADLRAKSPKQRARLVIDKCAHPMYRDLLNEYFQHAHRVSHHLHTPHDLRQALSWHARLRETGSMYPDHQQTKQPTTEDTEKVARKIDQTASANQ